MVLLQEMCSLLKRKANGAMNRQTVVMKRNTLHEDLYKLAVLHRKLSISPSMNEQNTNSPGIECTVSLNITENSKIAAY